MSILDEMIERRKALRVELDALLETVKGEARDMTEDEDADFGVKAAEIRKADDRIESLRAIEARDAAAQAAHKETASVEVRNEPNPVYREGDASTSFFRDLAASQLNQPALAGGASMSEVRGRLERSQETRAGDMTTVAGAGGEFAPPLWQVEKFIALARAGRPTADLMNKDALPSGVSSINLPKVSTGASAGVQATQNSALSDTAMTTTSVSSGITTIGGKQIISMQLLQQSGIPFDRVILQDLAKAYAVQVDSQVLYGSNGSGQVRGLVGVAANTAFTSSAPAPASVTATNSLYYTVAKAAAAMQVAAFESPNAIIMHPSRWAWILGSVDTQARPYVIPSGGGMNPLGTGDESQAQGFVGTFGSFPVYVDPNISLTANSATNQDEIYLVRREELYLYESAVQSQSFDATYADNASILFRVLGYMAFIPNRLAGSVGSIRGTGLVVV